MAEVPQTEVQVTSTYGITEDSILRLVDAEGKGVTVKVLKVDRMSRTIIIQSHPVRQLLRHFEVIAYDELVNTPDKHPTMRNYGPVRSRGKGKIKRWS